MIGSTRILDFSPMPTQYSRLISDFRLLIYPAHQQIEASLNRTTSKAPFLLRNAEVLAFSQTHRSKPGGLGLAAGQKLILGSCPHL